MEKNGTVTRWAWTKNEMDIINQSKLNANQVQWPRSAQHKEIWRTVHLTHSISISFYICHCLFKSFQFFSWSGSMLEIGRFSCNAWHLGNLGHRDKQGILFSDRPIYEPKNPRNINYLQWGTPKWIEQYKTGVGRGYWILGEKGFTKLVELRVFPSWGHGITSQLPVGGLNADGPALDDYVKAFYFGSS
jgi:hypothetical protein